MARGPTGNPRVDAPQILVQAMSGRLRSTDLLNRFLKAYPTPAARDAGLLHELVMGVLRRRLALESILSGHVNRPLGEARPVLGELLLTMAYQAVFLSRVPSHARVSASVDAARVLAGSGASRFVNAVGRSLERTLEKTDVLEGMQASLLYSMPGPVVTCMKEALERTPTDEELAATCRPAPSAFRVNRSAATREEILSRLETSGINARRTAHAPDGIVADSPGVLKAKGLVPRLLLPQDEASQLVVEALSPGRGERVVDLCAGNGLKTTQILACAPDASVVAVDRDGDKLGRCLDLCRSMGLRVPETVCADARRIPKRLQGTADKVLVDAPCTGIGTLVRRPEVRYLRTEADHTSAARNQAAILEAALTLLAPGGILVYAVCSFSPTEGPKVFDRVLEGRDDLVRAPCLADTPFVRKGGSVLTLPWRDAMDGFYVAAVRRSS